MELITIYYFLGLLSGKIIRLQGLVGYLELCMYTANLVHISKNIMMTNCIRMRRAARERTLTQRNHTKRKFIFFHGKNQEMLLNL